jgi:hypothetical protein
MCAKALGRPFVGLAVEVGWRSGDQGGRLFANRVTGVRLRQRLREVEPHALV